MQKKILQKKILQKKILQKKTSQKKTYSGEKPYKVLARKYRPQVFSELVGQEAMITILRNGFKQNRVPHAFMLSGIRGVGKTTTARLLARALNYQKGDINKPYIDFDTIGEQCQQIINASHPDVIEIDAASHNGVDDIRQLIEQATYRPLLARFRVYIMDEVHMLSNQAFSALLKILEEPPEHVKFIFATTEIHKLPVTILSRCQIFSLRRLQQDDIVAQINKIVAMENRRIDNEAAAMIARFSQGSMRDALSTLEQIMAYCKDDIDAQKIQQIFGMSSQLKIIEIFDNIFDGKCKNAIEIFRKCYQDGAQITQIIDELTNFCYLVTAEKIIQQEKKINDIIKTKAQIYAKKLNITDLDRFWQCITKGAYDIKNTHMQIETAEMLIIRLTSLASMPSPENIIKQIQKQAKNNTEIIQNSKQNSKQNLEQKLEQKLEQNNIPDNLQDFLKYLQTRREVEIKRIIENKITIIKYKPLVIEIDKESKINPDEIEKLKNMLRETTGKNWLIVFGKENKSTNIQENSRKIVNLNELENSNEVKKFKKFFPDSIIKDQMKW